MMTPTEIQNLIETNIPDAKAIVNGEDGHHFDAIIISEAFQGKTRVQQQQLVYAVLNQYILDGSLHAISLKTYTPESWQQEQAT